MKNSPIQMLVDAVGLHKHRIKFEALSSEPLTVTQMLKGVGVTEMPSLLKFTEQDLIELLEVKSEQAKKLLRFGKAAHAYTLQRKEKRQNEEKKKRQEEEVEEVEEREAREAQKAQEARETQEAQEEEHVRTSSDSSSSPSSSPSASNIDSAEEEKEEDKNFAEDLLHMFPELGIKKKDTVEDNRNDVLSEIREEIEQNDDEEDESKARIVMKGIDLLFPELGENKRKKKIEDSRDQEGEKKEEGREDGGEDGGEDGENDDEEESETEEEYRLEMEIEARRESLKEESEKRARRLDDDETKKRKILEEKKKLEKKKKNKMQKDEESRKKKKEKEDVKEKEKEKQERKQKMKKKKKKEKQQKKNKNKNKKEGKEGKENMRKKKQKTKDEGKKWTKRHDVLHSKILRFYNERKLHSKIQQSDKVKSLVRKFVDDEDTLMIKLLNKYGLVEDTDDQESNTRSSAGNSDDNSDNNKNKEQRSSNKDNKDKDKDKDKEKTNEKKEYYFESTQWLYGLSSQTKYLLLHSIVFLLTIEFQMMLLSSSFLLVVCRGAVKPPTALYWIGCAGPSKLFQYVLYTWCRLDVIGIKLHHLAQRNSPSSAKYNSYLSVGLLVCFIFYFFSF